MFNQNIMQFDTVPTKGVKQILILTSFIFIVQNLFPNLNEFFILFNYNSNWFYIWQPVTYIFSHQGIWHILFNMMSLWIFGRTFEKTFGRKELLILYFLCGIGTGLIWAGIKNQPPMLGSSASVYGILVAFAYFWPNAKILVMGVFPISAKALILILIAMSLLLNANRQPEDNIAHLAHLLGSVIAFFYLQIKYKRYYFFNVYIIDPIKKLWKNIFRKIK